MPPLRDIIADHGLAARKSLGQHFLLDLNITRKIVRLASVDAHSHVLEIGPGPGGLTRALLETGATVTVVEKDVRCIEILTDLGARFPGRLHIVEGDALVFDPASLAGERPIKIVANLPYNISTALLISWLRANHAGTNLIWSEMALMFQKEVADRILAPCGGKSYGRLAVMAQSASIPTRGFDLPARAFTPPPKVASSVVHFQAGGLPEGVQFSTLERIVKAAFATRRKMVRASLKSALGEGLHASLKEAGIPETARAEEISLEGFAALAKMP